MVVYTLLPFIIIIVEKSRNIKHRNDIIGVNRQQILIQYHTTILHTILHFYQNVEFTKYTIMHF